MYKIRNVRFEREFHSEGVCHLKFHIMYLAPERNLL